MAVIDLHDFNRQTYRFEYVRREFLGEVRCLVFDVAPINRAQPGKFIGRIWVEDRDDSIVRFNGTYMPAPPPRALTPERYFHFDSWRVNVGAGNVGARANLHRRGARVRRIATGRPASRRSRASGIMRGAANQLDELTSILIEANRP